MQLFCSGGWLRIVSDEYNWGILLDTPAHCAHEATLALTEITNRENSNEHNENAQKSLFRGNDTTLFPLVEVEKIYGGLEKKL